MSDFGSYLRKLRRQCQDPVRGGFLTQEKFGELIGGALGDRGYSGAAVSDWERGKSKIHQDDRLVLNAIINVLFQCGGIEDVRTADELLIRGNYRPLNQEEKRQIFSEQAIHISTSFDSQHGSVESHNKAKISAKRRKQLILLGKVNRFWVEGVLEKSLEYGPRLVLEMTSRNDLVDWPWSEFITQPIFESRDYSSDQLLEAYIKSDRALLILGQPGSGKTLSLIQLAGALGERVLDNPSEPIPVILNLASWAKQMQSITDWVIEELTIKYQIPSQYGRAWLENDELILLLDSYDQPITEIRNQLAEAINSFRKQHGLTGLVVCSRIDEYRQVSTKLRLGAAFEIQALNQEKIENYLRLLGYNGQVLEHEIGKNEALQQLAQSPLMLGIMGAIYNPHDGKPPEWQTVGLDGTDGSSKTGISPYDLLFSIYVARMTENSHSGNSSGREEVAAPLSWLAQKLKEHNQAVFLIEQLQPSWLIGRKWRLVYMLLSGFLLGSAGGLIMFLLWKLLRLTLPQLPAFNSARLVQLTSLSYGVSEFVTITFGNILLGLVSAMVIMFLFEYRRNYMILSGKNSQRMLQMILVGIATGFLTFVVVSWSSGILLGAAWCVAESFMYMAAARFAFGWNYQQDVRPVEALAWSWRHAINGLLVGLALTVVAEVIESLLYGYNGFSRTLTTLALAGFVLGGLRGRQIREKSRPNEGVWLSLRNAGLAAVFVAVPLAILTWNLRDPVYALIISLLSGLIAVSILGGSEVVKHFLLRLLLNRSSGMPWHYARFLDSAARLTFLRKVGGGYIFMHSLLQDFFAKKPFSC